MTYSVSFTLHGRYNEEHGLTRAVAQRLADYITATFRVPVTITREA